MINFALIVLSPKCLGQNSSKKTKQIREWYALPMKGHTIITDYEGVYLRVVNVAHFLAGREIEVECVTYGSDKDQAEEFESLKEENDWKHV